MQRGEEMCSLVFNKHQNDPIQGFTTLVHIFPTGKNRLVRARAHSGCKGIHTQGNLQEQCTVSNAGIINERFICLYFDQNYYLFPVASYM